MRGTSFVAGAGVAASLAGGTNMELAHVTDWLPTLVDAAGVWPKSGSGAAAAVGVGTSVRRKERVAAWFSMMMASP